MKRNSIIFYYGSIRSTETKDDIRSMQTMARKLHLKVIDTMKPKFYNGEQLKLYLSELKVTDIIVSNMYEFGSTVYSSICNLEELSNFGVNVHVTSLGISSLAKGTLNPKIELVFRVLKESEKFRKEKVSKKIKVGVLEYRKLNGKWGRRQGTGKTIRQLQEEYKTVIRDLKMKSGKSLQAISRDRGVSVGTVLKLRNIFLSPKLR